MVDHDALAAALHQARRGATAIAQLSKGQPLTLADAAVIARAGWALREDDGEVAIGWKMGLTSKAKMQQVGVFAPIVGRLYDATRIDDGGSVDVAAYCHPRVEPEIAFVLGRDLDADAGAAEILDAVALCVPALEVIDSRYRDFQFDLADVIADNTSAAAFVLGGPGRSPRDLAKAGLRLDELGIVFEIDGEVRHTASAAAILDGPAHALVALLRHRRAALRDPEVDAFDASALGPALRRGDIILAGAATEAVALAGVRHACVRVQGLGEARLHVQQR